MELPNAVGVLEKEALPLSSRLPSCCGVKEKIIRRFIRLKLRIEAKKKRKGKKQHLKDGHPGGKSQTKKVKKNSVLSLTSSNPKTAAPPPTCIRQTSLFHQLPEPSYQVSAVLRCIIFISVPDILPSPLKYLKAKYKQQLLR